VQDAQSHAHVDSVDALGVGDGELAEAIVLSGLLLDLVLQPEESMEPYFITRARGLGVTYANGFRCCAYDEREELEGQRHGGDSSDAAGTKTLGRIVNPS